MTANRRYPGHAPSCTGWRRTESGVWVCDCPLNVNPPPVAPNTSPLFDNLDGPDYPPDERDAL